MFISDVYYGGEALSVDQPQSLTCPFCGKMGYTETSLQDHVTADHPDTPYEVVGDASFTYLSIYFFINDRVFMLVVQGNMLLCQPTVV